MSVCVLHVVFWADLGGLDRESTKPFSHWDEKSKCKYKWLGQRRHSELVFIKVEKDAKCDSGEDNGWQGVHLTFFA